MSRRWRGLASFVALVALAAVVATVAGVSTRQESDAAAERAFFAFEDAAELPAPGHDEGADGRIINGERVGYLGPWSEFRSASFLVYYDGREDGMCGATFVAKRWLLTAAHCVTKPDSSTAVSPAYLFASNGTDDVGPVIDALTAGRRPSQVRELLPVQQVIVHPSYDPRTMSFDAAILKVGTDAKHPPTLMVGATEGALWGGGFGGVTVDVAGWGDTDPDPEGVMLSTTLLEGTVMTDRDSACAAAFGRAFDSRSMLCASSYEGNGVDACQGDSGGPLMRTAPDGEPRLVGLVSFGIGCGGSLPGVYTRVDAIRQWVEGQVGPASGTLDLPAYDPNPPVVGGGATLAIVEPVGATRVGARGATRVVWSQSDADPVVGVQLRSAGRGYWYRAVSSGQTEYLLGHANVRAGSSELCAVATSGASACTPLAKAAAGPRASAGVTSARLRGGKLTLRGRVAASTRAVQVRVVISGGRTKARSKTIRLRMKPFPRSTAFSTTVRWRGRAPRQLRVVTQVKVGAKWRSFTTRLR